MEEVCGSEGVLDAWCPGLQELCFPAGRLLMRSRTNKNKQDAAVTNVYEVFVGACVIVVYNTRVYVGDSPKSVNFHVNRPGLTEDWLNMK